MSSRHTHHQLTLRRTAPKSSLMAAMRSTIEKIYFPTCSLASVYNSSSKRIQSAPVGVGSGEARGKGNAHCRHAYEVERPQHPMRPATNRLLLLHGCGHTLQPLDSIDTARDTPRGPVQ